MSKSDKPPRDKNRGISISLYCGYNEEGQRIKEALQDKAKKANLTLNRYLLKLIFSDNTNI